VLEELSPDETDLLFCLSGDGESIIAGADDELQPDNRVLVVTHRRELDRLRKRFSD
jgi:Trk K+ transport system NAD-binding subunit